MQGIGGRIEGAVDRVTGGPIDVPRRGVVNAALTIVALPWRMGLPVAGSVAPADGRIDPPSGGPIMADETRWMTYAELAETLGIGGDSARNLVRRKRWARQTGNDGMARVGVPLDYIEESRAVDRATDDPIDPPSDAAIDGGIVFGILTSHISRLERELQTMKEESGADRSRLLGEHQAERTRLQSEVEILKVEREAERLRGVQVDALNAVIEAERQRIEDMRNERDALRADRDRWAAQADKLAEPVEAPVQRRGWWPFKRVG